jgi:hypothetical protein
MRKTTNNQFGLNLFGIHVLSMSKRIMNEVFECCERLDLRTYYQDTDSLHIACDDIPILANEFKNRYERELIGSQLGQFHSDFTANDGDSRIDYARRSIFISKKVYIDELVKSNGSIGIMSRMKGVPLKCVELTARRKNISMIQLYERLFRGKTITFDLTISGPSFNMKPSFSIQSRKEFNRRIRINTSE